MFICLIICLFVCFLGLLFKSGLDLLAHCACFSCEVKLRLFGWLVGCLVVCLFVCVFVCLVGGLFVCLSAGLFACLLVCLLACLFRSCFANVFATYLIRLQAIRFLSVWRLVSVHHLGALFAESSMALGFRMPATEACCNSFNCQQLPHRKQLHGRSCFTCFAIPS